MVRTIVLSSGAKTALFHLKMDHSMVHAVLNTHLPSFDSPIAMEEQQPSLQTPT